MSHSNSPVATWIAHYLEAKYPAARPIKGDMSFDAIGMDSLARVELITAIETHFAVKLEPTLAYDFITADALAGHIDGLKPAQARAA